MATTPGRIFVPGDAHVFMGPVGTTVGTSVTTFTGLTEVGLFTNDSLKFSTDPSFEQIYSHQAILPTRENETTQTALLECDLQEWSAFSFVQVYGGGVAAETSTGSGIWKFTPPAPGGRTEKLVAVQCIDGARIAVLIIPRCLQKAGVEHDLSRAGSSDKGSILPLRLSVLGGSSGVAPFYWLSNDSAFTPPV